MFHDALCERLMKRINYIDGDKIISDIDYFINQYDKTNIDLYNSIISNALVTINSDVTFLDNYAELLHYYSNIDRMINDSYRNGSNVNLSDALKEYYTFMTTVVVGRVMDNNKKNK